MRPPLSTAGPPGRGPPGRPYPPTRLPPPSPPLSPPRPADRRRPARGAAPPPPQREGRDTQGATPLPRQALLYAECLQSAARPLPQCPRQAGSPAPALKGAPWAAAGRRHPDMSQCSVEGRAQTNRPALVLREGGETDRGKETFPPPAPRGPPAKPPRGDGAPTTPPPPLPG